jgi:hypothetical protein
MLRSLLPSWHGATINHHPPRSCSAVVLQAKWFQEELWFPLAEWWIDTVLGTWEESVKVGSTPSSA